MGGALGLASLLPAGTQNPSLGPTVANAATPATNVLRIGFDLDPVSFDARVTPPTSAVALIMHVTEPLLHRDRNMKAIGVLAESWEPIAGKGWRFKLRKGVKFHNGEDFNAESVKYTVESLKDQSLKWIHPNCRSYVAVIDRVEIEDPYTVLLVTKRFSRSLPGNLTAVVMVPPKYASQTGQQFGLKPIGTGRYRFIEYVPGMRAVMDANPDYWGAKAHNSGLEIRFLKENATRLAALESGEVKLINNVPPDAVGRLKSRDDLVVAVVPTARVIQLEMEFDRGVFADKRVRHAMNYAVDKEALVKSIMGGMAEVARNPWHPSMMGTNKSLPQYDYNPDKAKQLLAEAGYPNGVEISFGSPAGRYLQDKLVSEAIAQQIAKSGFKAALDAREWGSYWTNFTGRKYDVGLVGRAPQTLDPDWTALTYVKANLTGYKNARVSELFDAADSTTDMGKADKMYQEIQALLWEDAQCVWLYFQPVIDAHSKQVQGWAPRTDEYSFYWDASVS
jgi:peptide/nickel transport system substrate-binding protein